MSKMDHMTKSLYLFFYRVAAMLYYAVLPIVVGAIKSDPMLVLLITLTVIVAAALTVIPKTVNPPAPPYRVVLLFYQVRTRLGLLKALTDIIPVHLGKQSARVNPNRGTI